LQAGTRFDAQAFSKEQRRMETLWIISTAVVVSLIAAAFRSRRSSPRNLGYVSRDWVMRHSTD
jgi:predicted exporter